jgi:hypothetical protein
VFQAHFILYVVLFQKFIEPQTIFFTLIILLKNPCLKDPGISTTVRYKTLLAPFVTCTLVLSILVSVLFALHDSGSNIGIAYTGNPLWLIGAYAPAGLKSFLKMSKNYEQKFLAYI